MIFLNTDGRSFVELNFLYLDGTMIVECVFLSSTHLDILQLTLQYWKSFGMAL